MNLYPLEVVILGGIGIVIFIVSFIATGYAMQRGNKKHRK